MLESYEPDGFEENVHEKVVSRRWNVAFGEEHFIVAALHEILLQRDRMTNVHIRLYELGVEQLQFGVKFR